MTFEDLMLERIYFKPDWLSLLLGFSQTPANHSTRSTPFDFLKLTKGNIPGDSFLAGLPSRSPCIDRTRQAIHCSRSRIIEQQRDRIKIALTLLP
jgi:hypothetical protein